MQPLLHALRRSGWGLGVLSNFDSRLLRILAELELADLFDFVLLPRHTGIPKPDTAAFTAALVAAGISPPGQGGQVSVNTGTARCAGGGAGAGGGEGEQVICVHVGDSITSDICGAVGAGMFGILVDRRGKWVDADGQVIRTPQSFPRQRAAIVPSFAAVAAVGFLVSCFAPAIWVYSLSVLVFRPWGVVSMMARVLPSAPSPALIFSLWVGFILNSRSDPRIVSGGRRRSEAGTCPCAVREGTEKN